MVANAYDIAKYLGKKEADYMIFKLCSGGCKRHYRMINVKKPHPRLDTTVDAITAIVHVDINDAIALYEASIKKVRDRWPQGKRFIPMWQQRIMVLEQIKKDKEQND
jgi:hypothetical protein